MLVPHAMSVRPPWGQERSDPFNPLFGFAMSVFLTSGAPAAPRFFLSRLLLVQRLGYVGDRIALQITHDTRMQVSPGIENPGSLVDGFGERSPVERLDQVEQPDLARRRAQGEAAGRAFTRPQHSLTSEILEDLGEKMSGDLLLLRDLPRHRIFSAGNPRQVDKGSDGVFGRPGVDHL